MSALRGVAHKFSAWRQARPGDAVVLAYHRVAHVDWDDWRLAVSPERFEEQMTVLRECFRPLPLDRLVESLAEGRVAKRSVVVTFDDGYRDNLLAAKPVLERHGVPATVFVVTGYVGTPSFWWDDVEEVAATSGMAREELRSLWRRLRELPHSERLAEIDGLQSTRTRDGERSPLSETELAALAGDGLVTIGAHTVTHAALPSLPRQEQLRELAGSKAHLDELLGRPTRFVSYPHGEYDATTLACVRSAGFSGACAGGQRAVRRRTRVLEIPRIHALDVPGDELVRLLEQRLR